MRTDRELLELAARAVGMLVLQEGRKWPRDNVGWFFNQVGSHPPALYDRSSLQKMWAPLSDDGDALRLAVKVKKFPSVLQDQSGVMNGYARGRRSWDPIIEPFGDDPDAAVRRSIVRAAAELGAELEKEQHHG